LVHWRGSPPPIPSPPPSAPPPPVIAVSGGNGTQGSNDSVPVNVCDLAGWLCADPADISTYRDIILLSLTINEGLEVVEAENIDDLFVTLAETADVAKAQIFAQLESLSESVTRVNISIACSDAAIADADASELRHPLRDAESATETFAVPVAETPLIQVIRLPDHIPIPGETVGDAKSPSRTRLLATALPAGQHPAAAYVAASAASTAAATVAAEGAVVSVDGDAPLLSLTTTESASPSPPPPSPPAPDDSYYNRMRSVAGLHLVWVMPFIAFGIMSCCALWWCASSYRMHEETPELFVAQEVAVRKAGPDASFITVGEEDIAEASGRIRSLRDSLARRA